jgi:hypothetical protein
MEKGPGQSPKLELCWHFCWKEQQQQESRVWGRWVTRRKSDIALILMALHKTHMKLDRVGHVCNPIYSGGTDQEGQGLRPAQGLMRSHLKKR